MKKIISMMLAIVMVLSLGVVNSVNSAKVLAAAEMAEAVDLSMSFTKTFTLGVSDTVQTLVMPVTFAQDVYSEVKVTFEGVTDTGFMAISKVPEMTNESQNFVSLEMTNEINVITTAFTKDKFDGIENLYLVLMKSKNDMNREVKVMLEVKTYENTAGGNIKAGQTVTAVKTGKAMEQYYKFTLPSAGKVTVQMSDYLTLCSASKKEIITFYSTKKKDTLILDKGTYYLKSTNTGITTFCYTYKKISLSGNRSKSKAESVKPGKKMGGTLSIGSKGYWYKCKIDKTKKFKFNYNLSGDLNVNVVIYKNNKKIAVGEDLVSTKKGTIRFINSGKSVTLNKGTYFIKVVPSGGLNYGKFTLAMK